MATHFRDKLYKYISDYANQQGGSPTFAEMTEAMGISPRSKSLITRSLRILAKEGKVTLTKQGRQLIIALSTKHLYLLGRISAGTPIEAIPQQQPIDINTLFQGDNRFALQVKGESMIDEGIFDGDFIICKPMAQANEGEIVIALIDQHNTTLKRISYKTRGMITLIPANTKLESKIYHPERIQIQGIYVGLIRISG